MTNVHGLGDGADTVQLAPTMKKGMLTNGHGYLQGSYAVSGVEV